MERKSIKELISKLESEVCKLNNISEKEIKLGYVQTFRDNEGDDWRIVCHSKNKELLILLNPQDKIIYGTNVLKKMDKKIGVVMKHYNLIRIPFSKILKEKGLTLGELNQHKDAT